MTTSEIIKMALDCIAPETPNRTMLFISLSYYLPPFIILALNRWLGKRISISLLALYLLFYCCGMTFLGLRMCNVAADAAKELGIKPTDEMYARIFWMKIFVWIRPLIGTLLAWFVYDRLKTLPRNTLKSRTGIEKKPKPFFPSTP